MLKDFEVIGKGFITEQGLPLPIGSSLKADPKHGNTRAGLHFCQLKPVAPVAPASKRVTPIKPKAVAAKAVTK